MTGLTPRWTPLRHHPEQQRLWSSTARFRVVPAGRRSGKTELAKRYGILRAIGESELANGRIVFAAPTHDQARDIFWEDLKRLVPRWAMRGDPREADREIRLVNGMRLAVKGLDKPSRIEGDVLDGIIVDEIANCKRTAWEQHVRPALSTPGRRPGWAWLIGVPEGRNHYYEIYERALESRAADGELSEWDVFTWPSRDILPPEEIDAARRDLDELTFQQEYEASFVSFAGRAYYQFERAVHARETLHYSQQAPLVFGFDFNVDPGVAVVAQEQDYHPLEPGHRPEIARQITGVIGEVWIPRNSNTPAVCRKLIEVWGAHQGEVLCYGDATGGARGTAKVAGSDWDIIRAHLRHVFGDRLRIVVPRENPKERARVNSLNARLRTADGVVHLLVDPAKAPHVVTDLEGVTLLEGGSGELQKDPGGPLTHLSDGLGYYVHSMHPITGRSVVTQFAR